MIYIYIMGTHEASYNDLIYISINNKPCRPCMCVYVICILLKITMHIRAGAAGESPAGQNEQDVCERGWLGTLVVNGFSGVWYSSTGSAVMDSRA